jgi:hypothetical protein
MTDREFAALAAPHVVKTRTVSGNMRLHGLRMKVQGMTDRLRGATLARADDDQVVAGLRRDLQDLARAAREVLSRLDSPRR